MFALHKPTTAHMRVLLCFDLSDLSDLLFSSLQLIFHFNPITDILLTAARLV